MPKKVLIVDDDTEMLGSLSLRLRKEGFDAPVAMNGPWPPVIYLTGIKSMHTEIEIKRRCSDFPTPRFIPLMSTVAQPIADLPSMSVESPPREMSKRQFKVLLAEGVTAKAKGSPVPGEDS